MSGLFGSAANSSDIKDHEVQPGPEDGVSALAWSPTMDYLSVASWDNKIRIYEIACNGYQIMSQPKFSYAHEAPALCTAFTTDGAKVISGGCDKALRVYDMASQQAMQIGVHDAPIKVCGVMAGNIAISAGWDKMLKYWDMRTPNPIATVQLPERAYAMDIKDSLMTIACAERNVCAFDLKNPGQIWRNIPSTPLKWQSRSISNMPDCSGFALGSIEGRVAIYYFDDATERSQGFTFKCHREGTALGVLNSVNVVDFNVEGTLASCGSDGTSNIWDKDSRQRLKSFPSVNAPISCGKFNRDGKLFAIGQGYDWSKGHENRDKNMKDLVVIRSIKPEDIKKKSVNKR